LEVVRRRQLSSCVYAISLRALCVKLQDLVVIFHFFCSFL
jgi:hypothetical protein